MFEIYEMGSSQLAREFNPNKSSEVKLRQGSATFHTTRVSSTSQIPTSFGTACQGPVWCGRPYYICYCPAVPVYVTFSEMSPCAVVFSHQGRRSVYEHHRHLLAT